MNDPQANELWECDGRLFYIIVADTFTTRAPRHKVYEYLEIKDEGVLHLEGHLTITRADNCNYTGETIPFYTMWKKIV